MDKKIVGNPTTTPMAIPDWEQKNPLKADYIKNKPNLSKVATSGSYNDLSDKPEKPTIVEGFGVPFDVTGTNLVSIRNVHPKEHDVEIATDAESVTVLGKNLISFPYHNTSATHKGVTFTVNEDGTITANGTNDGTGSSYIVIYQANKNPLPIGTYTISGAPTEDTYLQFSGVGVEAGGNSGKTFTITEGEAQNLVTCCVRVGKTVNNVVFKPMIEAGTQKTEFELYRKATYPVTDGKAIVKSVSPIMNFKTPTSGASIEVKGYQDGLAVIDELKQAILSLGGNI